MHSDWTHAPRARLRSNRVPPGAAAVPMQPFVPGAAMPLAASLPSLVAGIDKIKLCHYLIQAGGGVTGYGDMFQHGGLLYIGTRIQNALLVLQIVTWGSLVHCTDGLVLQFVTRTNHDWRSLRPRSVSDMYTITFTPCTILI